MPVGDLSVVTVVIYTRLAAAELLMKWKRFPITFPIALRACAPHLLLELAFWSCL